MVVEMLRITCPPDKREAFTRRDAAVWTRALEGKPGFLGKAVWFNPDKPGELVLVIHFESLELLKAIPQSWSDERYAEMGDLLMPETSEVFEVTAPDRRYRRS